MRVWFLRGWFGALPLLMQQVGSGWVGVSVRCSSDHAVIDLHSHLLKGRHCRTSFPLHLE